MGVGIIKKTSVYGMSNGSSMDNIGQRARIGFKWVTLGVTATNFLTLLTWFILAKLMGPAEFGKLAIVTMIMGLGKSVGEFGLSQAIIQRPSVKQIELNSLFWANMAIGIVMASLVVVIARPISLFYNQPDLVYLLRFSSFTFVLGQSVLLFVALLQKELQFKHLEFYTIIRSFIDSLVAIFLAYHGFGASSVVFSHLAAGFIFAVLVTRLVITQAIWWPKAQFSLSGIKPYYGFGVNVTGKAILNYLGRNIDILIIGKLLGTEVLGIYNFAKRLVEMPRTQLSTVFSRVAYPVYSKVLAHDLACTGRFETIYLKLTKIIAVIGLFLFGLGFTIAEFIIVLFGNEWQGSIGLIQIFAVVSVFELLSDGFASSAIYSFNKPQWVLWVDLLVTPFRIVFVFLATMNSIYIVAIVMGISVMFKSVLLQVLVNKLSTLTMYEYIKTIKHPLFAYVLGIVSAYILSSLVISTTGIGSELILGLLTGFAYCFIFVSYTWLIDKSIMINMSSELSKLFGVGLKLTVDLRE